MSETKKAKAAVSIDLNDPQYYFNRELSWLEFNRRVLHEAMDPRTPLLERVKFAAIFSANLDEFFMVRVASLQRKLEAEVDPLTPDGRSSQQQLDEISQQLHPMVDQLQKLLEAEIRPQLAAAGVHVLKYAELSQSQQHYLQQHFEKQVFPILTPLAVDPAHPFPVMSNLSLNLAVVLKDLETGEEGFARVKVPDSLPRFVPLPPEFHPHSDRPVVWAGVALEQVIAENLEALFPGMTIQEHHLFRVTRDADLSVQEEEADDLIEAISQELSKRRFGGSIVRFQFAPTMSEFVKQTLIKGMNVDPNDLYMTQGWLGVRDLMAFMALPLPHLKDPSWTPVIPKRLRHLAENLSQGEEAGDDIFHIIRQGDLLVHHPYESFTASVEHFITHAAQDPGVQAIKMTLYRTSSDSPIVSALIDAARHGKQVVALVEIKARFDEASNISWARALEEAGVHVVYGVMGLKTHTKILLVIRKEGDVIRHYVHIGTGNYNAKTAKIYTDLGLLSCREDLGSDLVDLFNYLTGFSKQKTFRKLLVAPVTLRDRMVALIRREIEHCQNGKPGRIIAKMNALIDPGIIKTLYQASQAGVQIDLIIRGMCCLRPGIPGVSDHIRVISIVGRYLEHSRIFHFHNSGQEEVFIGSADWMQRNLDRRVEAVTPVEDPDCARELKEILDILLADNRQAWDMQSTGAYIQRRPTDNVSEHSAQIILMERSLK
ncbi:RNA degradosome polyphosphate kinase [Leptolyngbya sp. 'hensonii']|uniref:polyphosphate kinase 1 n=1 Tax=Leptolyngbya sp. 'hensonii' TaxID=1922337 RepID=UPI00094F5D30|nr:polyphosphate kinase 1 [Leptolyngbya sp. 'hensonii']OLP18295.1 RNA degradosome polyphosphate kinase [Leptolyngbya sp. 'hensonii']